MPEEKDSKVEILIGRLDHLSWEGEILWWEDCFSLITDGKIECAPQKRLEPKLEYQEPTQYLEECRSAGREFGKFLAEREITQYRVSNMERIRSSTLERVRCYPMPRDGINEFKKALDDALGIKRIECPPKLRTA
jgi:hypothetical protein